MNALDHAKRSIGQRETAGKNRSPFIDQINREQGIPLGSPYCAAGVSHCFREAGATDFPFGGSSQAIRRWFQNRRLFSANPHDILQWSGALFGWTLPGGSHGHIGFVSQRWSMIDGPGRVLKAIQTVEFNTNRGGSRDGEGVFSLRRGVPVDGSHRLWFLNTSDLVGGAWW